MLRDILFVVCLESYGYAVNTSFLGFTQVCSPDGISVSSAVFAGLTSVPSICTQTHRPQKCATSVEIDHIIIAAVKGTS